MSRKAVVGFFSRDHEDCYKWLIGFLLNSSLVKDVRPVYIPCINLSHEAHQCSFAILYHTKNRGRLNVTNVMNSLYDEELETLWRILGKENVIVVIDDVEHVSDEEKTRILHEQYNIRLHARDLFLFSYKHIKINSQKNQKNLREIQRIIKAHNRILLFKRMREILVEHHLIIILAIIMCLLLLIMIIVLYEVGKLQSSVPQTTASPQNITANTTATI